MKMKPAHFTLVRFHHFGTSECLQHPGNEGQDVQMLKGHSSYGLSVLWIINVCLVKKNLIFTVPSATYLKWP